MLSSRSSKTRKTVPNWVIYFTFMVLCCTIAVEVFTATKNGLNEGAQRETTLSAQYARGADILSACIKETKQSADLAVSDPGKLDEILADAVTGNYDSGDNVVDNDKFLSAIQDAYPELLVVNATFRPVLATINECRHDYAKQQSIVRAGVSDFKSWKVLILVGARLPDEKLYIKTAGQTARGQAALKLMAEMGGKK